MTFKEYLKRNRERLSKNVELPASPARPEITRQAPLNQELLPYLPVRDAALARRGRRSSHVLLWAVAASFFALLAWAALAKIDESVTAVGQVVPARGVQNIQSLEGGILDELLVKEGQQVEAGDLLLRILNEQSGSVHRDSVVRQDELTIAVIRLEAELSGEEPKYPEALMRSSPEAVRRHNALLAARRQKNATELATLAAQLSRSKLEEQELLDRQKGLNESIRLAKRQRDLARQLFRERSYSEMDLLNQERQVQNIQAELDALRSSIPRTRAAITLEEDRLRLYKAERETRIRQELNEVSAELAGVREIVKAGAGRVIRTEVRSPVRGLVSNIGVTTRSGVIMPGQTIMQVVPVEDSLVIEARVRPQDIGLLRVGQKAKIRLSAYDFAVYGGMDAELEYISADTVEGRNGELHYQARLRTTSQLADNEGKPLRIAPGMSATADILIGRKSVLSYMTRPLLRARPTI